MDQQPQVVMYDSPEAAKIETVTGWRARTGEFWGDNEHMARYCGSTHKRCDKCGGVVEKSSWCNPCHAKGRQEKFASYPRKAWDGVAPICMFDGDTYFFSADELADYCSDHNVKASELQLVFCEPNFARPLEPEDHFADELPEDGDVPGDIAAAFAALNEVIAAHKEPLSWSPGDEAVDPASVATLDGEG